ncbi:MAG: 2-amino-4-hydroxy-6-hydroxymethyldihydropteridine diphosphokinase [Elusimicrobiota bacterium]
MSDVTAVLCLGSNLGARGRCLARARAAIARWPKTRIVRASKVLETAPEGYLKQPAFLNQALEVVTGLAPMAMLIWAKLTENDLGRKHRRRWGPREIDIDILLYGNKRIQDGYLTIPHPQLRTRKSIRLCLASLKAR